MQRQKGGKKGNKEGKKKGTEGYSAEYLVPWIWNADVRGFFSLFSH